LINNSIKSNPWVASEFAFHSNHRAMGNAMFDLLIGAI
jgi:hypothetical protein